MSAQPVTISGDILVSLATGVADTAAGLRGVELQVQEMRRALDDLEPHLERLAECEEARRIETTAATERRAAAAGWWQAALLPAARYGALIVIFVVAQLVALRLGVVHLPGVAP